MILLLYPWQNHKGATHLKKIDTPSLVGWCFAREMFPAGNAGHDNNLERSRFRSET